MVNNLKIYIFMWIIVFFCISCHADNNYHNVKQNSLTKSYSENTTSAKSFKYEQNGIDHEVQKFLGHKCLDIILNPEKVETYQITWAGQSNQNTNNIQGYPVIQKGRSLDNKETGLLNKIIKSGSSYDFKWSKRIRIRPSHALRFIRFSEKVDIAVDFNTRQWAFYHDDKIMTEDISKSAVADLRNIIGKSFNSGKLK